MKRGKKGCPYSLDPIRLTWCVIELGEDAQGRVTYATKNVSPGGRQCSGFITWGEYATEKAFRAALVKVVCDPAGFINMLKRKP